MKICPRCNNNHDKIGLYCSLSCANKRTHSEETKRKISEKNKKWFLDLNDEDKKNYKEKLRKNQTKTMNILRSRKPTEDIRISSKIENKKVHSIDFYRYMATIRNKIYSEKKKERIKNDPFDTLSLSEKRARILFEQNFKCDSCDIGQEWNNRPLKFDLDHIDGDKNNNFRENLRFICPNCHSQTATYKTKNAKNKKYSDEEIIQALNQNDSVYHALKSLGMNLHGGNYIRIRNIIKKYNLKLGYLPL